MRKRSTLLNLITESCRRCDCSIGKKTNGLPREIRKCPRHKWIYGNCYRYLAAYMSVYEKSGLAVTENIISP